jgi:hypothetical protein
VKVACKVMGHAWMPSPFKGPQGQTVVRCRRCWLLKPPERRPVGPHQPTAKEMNDEMLDPEGGVK